MRVEYDPVKSIANQAKHGVSLAVASELDWDAAPVWIDDRFEYGQMRMIGWPRNIDPLLRSICGPWSRA